MSLEGKKGLKTKFTEGGGNEVLWTDRGDRRGKNTEKRQNGGVKWGWGDGMGGNTETREEGRRWQSKNREE